MTLLVDTSVLVAGAAALREVADAGESWAISVVTAGELEAGVLLAAGPSVRAMRLRRMTAVLAAAPVLPIDRAVAARYAEIRAVTGRRPSNDLWIAAAALTHDLTLVTADDQLAALPLIRSIVVKP